MNYANCFPSYFNGAVGSLNKNAPSFNDLAGGRSLKSKGFCDNLSCLGKTAQLYTVRGLGERCRAFVSNRESSITTCPKCGHALFFSNRYTALLGELEVKARNPLVECTVMSSPARYNSRNFRTL